EPIQFHFAVRPRPAEQGEDDETDAKDGRVEIEVAAQAATDAREHLVRRAPFEPPHSIGMCDVFGHAPSLPGRGTHGHPDFPWSHPHSQERATAIDRRAK